jgi:integrase
MVEAAKDPVLGAALRVMSETGIRVGGLCELTVRPDGQYATHSKGKTVKSQVPITSETLKHLAPLGSRPFAGLPVDALRMRINRHIAGLYQTGRISARFSPHDFRHFFDEKNKSRGLYWLARALGHSAVGVTELYLRNSLGVDPKTIEE